MTQDHTRIASVITLCYFAYFLVIGFIQGFLKVYIGESTAVKSQRLVDFDHNNCRNCFQFIFRAKPLLQTDPLLRPQQRNKTKKQQPFLIYFSQLLPLRATHRDAMMCVFSRKPRIMHFVSSAAAAAAAALPRLDDYMVRRMWSGGCRFRIVSFCEELFY